MLMKDSSFVNKINENTVRFRTQMTNAGFTISGENHAICPVMIGDAALASQMADDMLGNTLLKLYIEFYYIYWMVRIFYWDPTYWYYWDSTYISHSTTYDFKLYWDYWDSTEITDTLLR